VFLFVTQVYIIVAIPPTNPKFIRQKLVF